MFFSRIALHTLINNRRQYVSLFSVCLAGITIMLSALWVTDGMLKAVHNKSKQYYGGDITLMGGDISYSLGDTGSLIQTLKGFLPEDVTYYSRIDYDARKSYIFFEGMTVRQRMAKGVDFEAERDLFSAFDFVEGNAEPSEDHNNILISKSIAARLGVRAGDTVTYQVYTDKGYKNTINLVISGIFNNNSLFGMYTLYIDIRALRKVTARPDDYVNRICMYFNGEEPGADTVALLQNQLAKVLPMYPRYDCKKEFYHYIDYDMPRDDISYALISLDANIQDLQLLIDAIKAVVLLIIIVLMAIISVGIGSTYKIIIMKRITEIGTYRAIGMKPGSVKFLFLTESFYLLTAGFLAGVLLTGIVMAVLTQFSFSFIPAMDIFLENGRLRPSVSVVKSVLLFFVIAVTTISSMLFTIRNVVSISPVGALATTT